MADHGHGGGHDSGGGGHGGGFLSGVLNRLYTLIFLVLVGLVVASSVAYRFGIDLHIPHYGGTGPIPSADTAAAPAYGSQPQCNGPWRVANLRTGDTPLPINPQGISVVEWGVESGRVTLIDGSGNSKTVGTEENHFNNFWPERAAAATPTAVLHYRLVTC